jgi:AraC family transcriptional regulator
VSVSVPKSPYGRTPPVYAGPSRTLPNACVNLKIIPKNAPTELIDFSGVASLPRSIKITQRITSGSVTIGRYLPNQNLGIFIGATQHVVMVHEGAPLEMEWLLPCSDTHERRWVEQGDVDIHPCDTLIYKRWKTSSRMLFMAIDSVFVSQIVEEVFDRHSIELKLQIGIRDAVIEGMAEAWREELQVRGAGGRVHAEALATALIVHLFRTYGGGGANLQVSTGGMNGTRLRRVVEHMEEHLSEDISLCTLASIAGFSVHHFSDVFKTETGFAPYQFLIERRMHRAKEILLRSDTPIAQIALDVGFSSQSHFTEHFRKSTGTTPLRYRRARKYPAGI